MRRVKNSLIIRAFTSYNDLINYAKNLNLEPFIFQLVGTDTINLPDTHNNHFGIMFLNSTGNYGKIVIFSFSEQIFTAYWRGNTVRSNWYNYNGNEVS